jgi:hypothetical protein
MIAAVLAATHARHVQGQDFSRIIVPLLIMGGLILAAWCTLVVIRRRLRSGNAAHGTAFTLAELRTLRDTDQITSAEFDRAKHAMLGSSVPPKAKD